MHSVASMSRRYVDFVWIGQEPNRFAVGYSTKERGEYLALCFEGPEDKRLEKMTNWSVKKKIDANFILEATRIITKAFEKQYHHPAATGFDEALNTCLSTAADLRPDTHTAYRKAVRILRETLREHQIEPKGPNEVTAETAEQFARFWLSGTYKRGKASDAKTYQRKPATLNFYLRQLSALWSKHFVKLGYAKANPWKAVDKRREDQQVKRVPTEEEVTKFFDYLQKRYPTWQRLHDLLTLKALAGCRTLDICQLRTEQLTDGRVTWEATQQKQRKGRAVAVPTELFNSLKKNAGKVWLWDGMIADMAKYRPSRNELPENYEPKTVFWCIGNIFREFGEAHPDLKHVTPHSLRRRAITLTVAATGSVDATSEILGVSAPTARRSYLDAKRAFNTDKMYKELAPVLLPKKTQADGKMSPTKPPQSENKRAQSRTKANKRK
jgi:integrase